MSTDKGENMTKQGEDGPKKETPVREKWATIILAAGKGTRMKSQIAKALHPIQGRAMLYYPIKLAKDIESDRVIVVVGHQAELIREAMDDGNLIFVHQEQQLGTGHAIQQTKDTLNDFDGHVLILCGDVPLLLPSTVKAMTAMHIKSHASITVLTALLEDPSGYGRIVKDERNNVRKIVEERDADDNEKKIKEINTGIYCAQSRFLFEAVEQIDDNNVQKEYYLTDIIEIASRRKAKVISSTVADPVEVMGINTMEDLEKANSIMTERGGKSQANKFLSSK